MQQENPNFGIYKEYLKSGQFPEGFNLGEDPVDFRLAQALLLRRHAIINEQVAEEQDDPESKLRAQNLRKESRQALRNPYNLVNHEILQSIFNFDKEFSMNDELASIIDYLQSDEVGYAKGGKKLPILSSIDPNLLTQLQQHFDLQVIPADQIDITDFENILSESEVPEWFKNITKHRKETEHVNLFSEIRQRWFLFVCVMLAVAAAAGFIFD